MNLEEFLSKHEKHPGLTMGALRNFIKENTHLSDSTLVLSERVEDRYFKDYNWNVYKHEGIHYYYALEQNERMDEEIERRARGEEWEYDKLENPNEAKYSEEDLENQKEQFFYSWSITNLQDKAILIHNHY